MKKKIIIFSVAIFILISIGTVIYLTNNSLLFKSVNINYVENIDIKLKYQEPFKAYIENNPKCISDLSYEDYYADWIQNKCLYIPINEENIIQFESPNIEKIENFEVIPTILYMTQAKYNLEGYTLEQFYENNILNYEIASFLINKEKTYLINNDNIKILKSVFYEENEEVNLPYLYLYTILKNDVFYNFKIDIPQSMKEETISLLDEIIKNIKIEDYNKETIDLNTVKNTSNNTPYFYSLLNAEEKQIYTDILNTIKKGTKEEGIRYDYKCKNFAEYEKYMKIYRYIKLDYEDYFRVIPFEKEDDLDFNLADNKYEDYEKYEGDINISFFIEKDFIDQYNYEKYINKKNNNKIEYYEAIFKKIDEVANPIIESIPSNLTEYGKYMWIANELCKMAEYDYSVLYIDPLNPEATDVSYNLIGPFLENKCVCLGYAHAYKYLCRKAGLFCETIQGNDGNIDEAGHIWNVVTLGDKFYYIDVTWMDGSSDWAIWSDIFNYNEADEEHKMYLDNIEYESAYRFTIFAGGNKMDNYMKSFLNTGNVNWKMEKNLLKDNEE